MLAHVDHEEVPLYKVDTDEIEGDEELTVLQLKEDRLLAGFVPLLAAPQEPCYTDRHTDMVRESKGVFHYILHVSLIVRFLYSCTYTFILFPQAIAADCKRVTVLKYFLEALCGQEEPLLAFKGGKYVSVATSPPLNHSMDTRSRQDSEKEVTVFLLLSLLITFPHHIAYSVLFFLISECISFFEKKNGSTQNTF